MVIMEGQPMSRKELGDLLDGLPDPNTIVVSLHGNYKLADLARETDSLVPGAKVSHPYRPANFVLQPPYTNDLVLRLYDSDSRVAHDDNRTMHLERVEWKLGDDTTVTLEPLALTITYEGEEPRFVAQLRAKLQKPATTTMTISTVTYE